MLGKNKFGLKCNKNYLNCLLFKKYCCMLQNVRVWQLHGVAAWEHAHEYNAGSVLRGVPDHRSTPTCGSTTTLQLHKVTESEGHALGETQLHQRGSSPYKQVWEGQSVREIDMYMYLVTWSDTVCHVLCVRHIALDNVVLVSGCWFYVKSQWHMQCQLVYQSRTITIHQWWMLSWMDMKYHAMSLPINILKTVYLL